MEELPLLINYVLFARKKSIVFKKLFENFSVGEKVEGEMVPKLRAQVLRGAASRYGHKWVGAKLKRERGGGVGKRYYTGLDNTMHWSIVW